MQRLRRFVALLVVGGVVGAAQAPSLEAGFGLRAILARQNHGAVEVLAGGEGAGRVYVFLPERPALRGRVPVVFFHHGWLGMSPKNFGALIDHLVREGQVVIYPVYQDSGATSPQVVVANAAAADRAGLRMLAAQNLVPDRRRILYYGYSMGAAISLDLATDPAGYGLPAPDAMLLAAPGDAPAVATGANGRSIIGDLRALPRGLPIAVLAGAQDVTIGLPTALALFPRLCAIRPDRRVLMVLPGGSHDGQVVHAQHGAPGAPDARYDFSPTGGSFPKFLAGQPTIADTPSFNQLDIYGFWKVIDALVQSLPAGTLPDSVFGHGNPAQRYLGTWPDGTPYPPIQVEDVCQ